MTSKTFFHVFISYFFCFIDGSLSHALQLNVRFRALTLDFKDQQWLSSLNVNACFWRTICQSNGCKEKTDSKSLSSERLLWYRFRCQRLIWSRDTELTLFRCSDWLPAVFLNLLILKVWNNEWSKFIMITFNSDTYYNIDPSNCWEYLLSWPCEWRKCDETRKWVRPCEK